MSDVLDIDLYQARMLIAFHREGKDNTIGTMEAFVRSMSPKRRFLVVCGVERIVEYLKNLRFTSEDIHVLKRALHEVDFDVITNSGNQAGTNKAYYEAMTTISAQADS